MHLGSLLELAIGCQVSDKVRMVSASLNQLIRKCKWSWEYGKSLIDNLGFASLVAPLGHLFSRCLQQASRELSELSEKEVSLAERCSGRLFLLRNLSILGRFSARAGNIFVDGRIRHRLGISDERDPGIRGLDTDT